MADLLENYLEGAEGAGKVLAHARLLRKLAASYQESVPPHLGENSHVANLKSGIVVIHARSGALATKLRQMAPTLLRELSTRGVECSGLQVKVQARRGNQAARAATNKPLSIRTSQELAALSDSLPVSPLRNALEMLLARSARRE